VSELFESTAAYASAVCYLAALTILKPLYGAEPDLYANLASFCRQDYPAPVQIVFGLADPADPAAAVVRRLMADFPDRDLELVINARRHGANAKVSNLINMQIAARHETMVIADSDIAVPSDYLTNIAANLGEPCVGLVTCLYRGVGATGIWSRLAAAGIDYHFLPNVLVGLKLGLATPCFGSTIALTRTTLAKRGAQDCRSLLRLSSSPMSALSDPCANCCCTTFAGHGPSAPWILSVLPASPLPLPCRLP